MFTFIPTQGQFFPRPPGIRSASVYEASGPGPMKWSILKVSDKSDGTCQGNQNPTCVFRSRFLEVWFESRSGRGVWFALSDRND
ncbi:MAG: hypothetical protein HW380_1381 [Magnetococcales bacterium]|nr:hypothetical protein [Magnetococcales bacterium]